MSSKRKKVCFALHEASVSAIFNDAIKVTHEKMLPSSTINAIKGHKNYGDGGEELEERTEESSQDLTRLGIVGHSEVLHRPLHTYSARGFAMNLWRLSEY